MTNGFTLILGAPRETEEDPEVSAAKVALKRFREAKDDSSALDALSALVQFAQGRAGREPEPGGDEGG